MSGITCEIYGLFGENGSISLYSCIEGALNSSVYITPIVPPSSRHAKSVIAASSKYHVTRLMKFPSRSHRATSGISSKILKLAQKACATKAIKLTDAWVSYANKITGKESVSSVFQVAIFGSLMEHLIYMKRKNRLEFYNNIVGKSWSFMR